MKQRTFTTKAHHPTGKWKSFESTFYDIKLNKKLVGTIYEEKFGESFTITFMIKKVPTKESPCLWKRITLKHKPTSIEETKEFLKNKTEAILNKYDIYEEENN